MSIKKVIYVLTPITTVLLCILLVFFSTKEESRISVTGNKTQLTTVQAAPVSYETEENNKDDSYQLQIENQNDNHAGVETEVSPIVSTQSQTVNISQGEKINIGIARCTAGYIDQELHQLYLAGHCVNAIGEKAYNENWELIGEVIRDDLPNHNSDFWLEANDFSIIQLYGESNQPTNSMSGDNIISYSEVHVGDPVCAYGSTTQKVFCGLIEESENGFFKFILDGDLQGGDSGGPVWIPGEGLIGTVSGFHNEFHTATSVTI